MSIVKKISILTFWLVVWQLVSMAVGNPVLFCGPYEVGFTLVNDVVTSDFWLTIGFSLLRITIGFFAALILAFLFGTLAWRVSIFATIFDPAVQFVKSVPIVCFIVLLLIWFGASYVSAIAVFLVAFPAFYFSIIEGLRARDDKQLEMLRVFGVSPLRRGLALYWPTMLPFLLATSRVAVGMSWKAGVAAELIGLPLGSIGEGIYQAKITLSSADLLAWTLVIVLISLICEKIFLWLLKKTEDWSWGLALPRFHGGKTDVAPNADNTLQFKNVTKGFEDQSVINDLSFTLDAGEKVGLTSPSGSGKTTLLTVLSGLVAPDQGEVTSKKEISIVFQEARLFENRNAIDNVLIVAGTYLLPKEVEASLGEILPLEELKKPVAQLSGGQRRRVEIARAMAAPSTLVILDEPFTGLDKETKSGTTNFILDHLEGRILVVASHEKQDLENLGITRIIQLA